MNASFEIKVDEAALKDAIGLFEFVGGNTSDAIRVAINKAAPKVKTMASKRIREEVRLTASYVNEKLTVRKATKSRLNGAVLTPMRGLLMSKYSTDAQVASDKIGWIKPPPVPVRGIRVKIKPSGDTKVMDGAFYMVLNKGKNGGGQLAIAIREGAARKPVKVFQSASLSQVFGNVRGDVLPAAGAEYQAQLLDAMRYLLAKQHPMEGV